ncbi:MAG: sel1 repeat family protein [Oligoflexia bacterium]|nr:sel1 repeat family protein [Oligoflexia bacterium]
MGRVLFLVGLIISLLMTKIVYSLEEYAGDKAIDLPDSVKEYMDGDKEGLDGSLLKSRAIMDIKQYADMMADGKDTISALQYLVIGAKLFPYRKDIIARKNEIIENAVQATLELEKSKNKDCSVILKRVAYILSVAPDISSLSHTRKLCGKSNKIVTAIEESIVKIINKKIPTLGLNLSEQKCNNGNMNTCLNLAIREHRYGNKAKAKRLFTKICDSGFAMGCDRLGVIEYVGGSKVEAKRLFTKACDRGFTMGCDRLGMIEYVHGSKVEAKRLFTKLCDVGECYGLGVIEHDNGNKNEAKRLFGKACDSGSIEGCFELGKSEGRNGNKAEAKRLFTKTCDDGFIMGCRLLGLIELQSGNRIEAKRLFTKTCEEGKRLECFRLANLESEIGSKAKAKRLYAEVCDGGNAMGCDFLGRLEYEGGNKAKAKRLFIKACDGGAYDGCYNVACELSISKNQSSALDYLEKALSMGYDDFEQMGKDRDLDNIRETSRYKSLINKFKK